MVTKKSTIAALVLVLGVPNACLAGSVSVSSGPAARGNGPAANTHSVGSVSVPGVAHANAVTNPAGYGGVAVGVAGISAGVVAGKAGNGFGLGAAVAPNSSSTVGLTTVKVKP